jgi:hypothetical protein
VNRDSSGFVEGLNNKLKVRKRLKAHHLRVTLVPANQCLLPLRCTGNENYTVAESGSFFSRDYIQKFE